MANLDLALVPTDAEMAEKVNMGHAALASPARSLGDKTTPASFAPTKPNSPNPPGTASLRPQVTQETRFYEVEL